MLCGAKTHCCHRIIFQNARIGYKYEYIITVIEAECLLQRSAERMYWEDLQRASSTDRELGRPKQNPCVAWFAMKPQDIWSERLGFNRRHSLIVANCAAQRGSISIHQLEKICNAPSESSKIDAFPTFTAWGDTYCYCSQSVIENINNVAILST